ncbi:MAG: aspartate--ammonia ligase [Oscillospiraceae bacterium]|nr:aspartate--ammonia ligase [Oscillospiraceae bacterium]
MNNIYLPAGYKPLLETYQLQRAIEFIKGSFQVNLRNALNLKRVSAPLFVDRKSGLNDNLNGIERPVSFEIAATGGSAEVVQSLAKWKRQALQRYDFHTGKGLYTDMNAIRRDEESLDNLHSVYVDQWDWEKAITRADRTLAYLQDTVTQIVSAICDVNDSLRWEFPVLHTVLARDVTFITTQALADLYPALTPSQRETEFVRTHKTVFLMQIGKRLRDGTVHDGRAPDYDDWDLNGDILFWNDVLGRAFEISSMGIRVDAESLRRQLALAGCPERAALPFHDALLHDALPLSIGGGIGQSRLCMLLLGCAHIGEVQVSLWDDETMEKCAAAGIPLL